MNVITDHVRTFVHRWKMMRSSARVTANGVASWQWVLFGLLQLFNFYQLTSHAMWRDEMHTWTLVRASNSIADLFSNMRYDGFPSLWYLSLWTLSRIFASPFTMQLFHFMCSLSAQLLIMARAPFPAHMKLAVVAGYFLSFEYCIISRAYVLGVLLIFLYCALQSRLGDRPALRAAILGLLANTTVFGAILSLAFAAEEVRILSGKRAVSVSEKRLSAAWFLGVYLLLLIMAIVVMMPPTDSTFATNWNFSPDLGDAFALLIKDVITLAPVPLAKTTFWNSLVLFQSGKEVAIPAAIVLACALWFALRAHRDSLHLFVVGFAGIWIFTVIKYQGYVRHAGMAMILFISCLWIAAENSVEHRAGSPAQNVAVWAILTVNLLAWSMASYYHATNDFSGSRKMADFIRQAGIQDAPLVADIDYAVFPVAGYLGQPLYAASTGKPQTFIKWSNQRMPGGMMAVLDLAGRISARTGRPSFLLLNYPPQSGPNRLLYQTPGAIVDDEVLYLYEYDAHRSL